MSAAALSVDPNTDLISFALSKARTSVVEQVFASPALNDGSKEKHSLPSRASPEVEPDERAKLRAVQSRLKTSRTRSEAGAGGTRRPDDTDRGSAVNGVVPARKAVAGARDLDDAQDLADLLNKIA